MPRKVLRATPRPARAPQAPPPPPQPVARRALGRPVYQPPEAMRMLVEIMTMAGFSKEAMCRELVYRQQPCADVETLDRAFAEELANGRQRRLTGYIVKLHTIAMGNGNSSLSALKFVLSKIGGAVWAGGSDTGDMEDAALVAAAAIAGNGTETRRIYIPARLPEPPDDAGPVIEGETEEAA